MYKITCDAIIWDIQEAALCNVSVLIVNTAITEDSVFGNAGHKDLHWNIFLYKEKFPQLERITYLFKAYGPLSCFSFFSVNPGHSTVVSQ